MIGLFDVFPDGPAPDPNIVAAGFVPPLPYAVYDQPTLIWGSSVVQVAMTCGRDDLPVHLVQLDKVEALMLAIRMEGRGGSYTLREQMGIAVAAKEAGVPLDGELSRLVRGDRALADVVHRISGLPVYLAHHVIEGAIDLKIAERLEALPSTVFSSDEAALQRLSHSRRRQSLEMLAEISRRDGLSHTQVTDLATEALAAADPADFLRRLRLPTLVGMETEFRAIVERFAGSGVTVSAPPYFEGDSYGVEFRFRSCEELAKRVSAVERLKDSCDELLGIL